jgi:hypothetical protein
MKSVMSVQKKSSSENLGGRLPKNEFGQSTSPVTRQVFPLSQLAILLSQQELRLQE